MPKQSPISREVVSEVQIDEPIPVEATPAAFANSSKDRHELTWAEGRRLVRAGRTVSPSQKLENDLALAKALYLTRCEYQSGKRRREDREHAAKIGKLAKRLAKLFDERGGVPCGSHSIWSAQKITYHGSSSAPTTHRSRSLHRRSIASWANSSCRSSELVG